MEKKLSSHYPFPGLHYCRFPTFPYAGPRVPNLQSSPISVFRQSSPNLTRLEPGVMSDLSLCTQTAIICRAATVSRWRNVAIARSA